MKIVDTMILILAPFSTEFKNACFMQNLMELTNKIKCIQELRQKTEKSHSKSKFIRCYRNSPRVHQFQSSAEETGRDRT